METFFITLLGLLLSFLPALPLGFGFVVAARHMRAGQGSAYLRNLCGSIVAGAVVLYLLWGSLFGDDLSSSSTAGLAFIFAPIYAAAAQGIILGIGAAAMGKAEVPEKTWLSLRWAILVPVCILTILMTGVVKNAFKGNDLAVAEWSSNPQTLHRLFEQSRTGEADPFGVPLFLAQNSSTPPEILVELAKHEHPAVRVHVAQHPMTPDEVVAILAKDNSSFVRKVAQKRLGTKAP